MEYNHLTSFAWSLRTGVNDLSGNINKAVKIDSGVAKAIEAATDVVVGFQTNDPTGANQGVSLESNGIVLAKCGAAVTAGLEVTIMADGTIENKNGANTVVGTALKTGVLGDCVSVKLKNM